MFQRLSPEEVQEIEQESLTRVPEVSDYTQDRLDTWKMFQVSYRVCCFHNLASDLRTFFQLSGQLAESDQGEDEREEFRAWKIRAGVLHSAELQAG